MLQSNTLRISKANLKYSFQYIKYNYKSCIIKKTI